MSKLLTCLFLTGFAMVSVLWSIALFILVVIAKDILKPRH